MGLAYLHELASGAITHRDLKPSNLLFKVALGRIVALYYCSSTSNIFTNIFGTFLSETTMRPIPALQGRLPQDRRHGPEPRAGAGRDRGGDGLERRHAGVLAFGQRTRSVDIGQS